MSQDTDRVRLDSQRLDTLRDTGLLDSEVEEQFDRLTRLASTLLGAPATFFSLVDEDRDYYKSCFGFAEPLATEREITGTTFCHFSLVAEGALVIPDTRADPAYRNVPTVESLGVSAYIGVPVHAPNGDVLGSFCAIDFVPRDWTPLDIATMKELATSAEREVAIRHWMRRQTQLMEREFAAREELERVMESRARLIRGFTHDVKNPLGAGNGFLALLEDEIFGPLTDQQRHSIGRVRRAIGNALSLIDELIEIARSEKGELEVDYDPVVMHEVVRELTEEYRPQAAAKGLTIECAVPDDVPVIHTDPVRIRQVLGNLLSNAVKYTRAGTIRVGAATRSGTGPRGRGEWAAVDVVDTGPGIPEEQLHLLFQEFERLDPESAAGSGLGLSISQRLAEAMGGTISVDSRVGEGSTFTLWLPVHGRRAGPRTGTPAREAVPSGAA